MAPISLKKGIIDVLAGDLIKHMLNVAKGDENYKIAIDYVMSNFRFHRFLDVNPLDVSRSLSGLCSKFQVNSQDKKAQYLEEQVEKFVNLPLLEVKKEDREVQTDAHYALLSFLLNLSNNPLNTEFSPRIETVADTSNAVFDWTKTLLWGEKPLSLGIDMDEETEQNLYDSDNEIWILSESEEEVEVEEEHLYDEVTEIQKGFAKKIERTSKDEELQWIQNNVVQSYWIDNEKNYMNLHTGMASYSVGSDAMCKNWEIFQKKDSKQPPRPNYQRLTEKQLVRETIWMLHGIENLHVYKFQNGRYEVNDDIIVSHMSKETTQSLLSSFTALGNKVMLLKQFAERRADNVTSSMSKTIQVFQYTIARFLMERKRNLAALEKTLIDKVETITLLTLKKKLHDDFTKVTFIHQLFIDAVVKGHTLYSTVTERVVYFMDVFYETLCTLDGMGDAGLEKVLIILPYFLDICQPYLHDLDRWMTMGQLPAKTDEEFMIYKSQTVSKAEHSYWYQTFKVKESRKRDGSTGKLIPEFIKTFQKQVLLSGKSLGLLAEFGEFATSVLSTESIHDEFKRCLKTTIREANTSFLKGEHLPIGEYEVDGAASFVKDYNIDPLIRENFQNMFLDRYHHLKQDKKGNQLNSSNDMHEWQELLKDGSCRPPMKTLIQQSLSPVVLKRYDKACAVLLTLFKKELNLLAHLDVMKNFFLMQAAGTMHSFYSEIFDKAKRKAFWQDMPYLNIVLQDALQVNYPQLMGRLTVKFHTTENTSHTNAHLFDGLSLQYKAPWPVSIILDTAMEEKYNEIFKFLLKVKRAIWVLEQLRFFELMSDVSIHDGSDDDEPVRRACKLKDMELPPQLQKLKLRMLVLRMKMLHTIRSFHFYLMTRIEDSIRNEFQKDIETARDLDEILERHQSFLHQLKQKCFLHEKVGRSREAILRTVTLVFDFEEIWMQSVHALDVKRLNGVEKDYGRCTSFLHSFFSTLAKRGSFPQFDFLANAMKVETHQKLFRR